MENSQGEIVMYQPDETVRLEVRMGDETVWLSKQQMAELFGKDRTVISRHISNIYREGELQPNTTCAKFAHMGSDGDQSYEYTAYNLDVIISVGYRVKSKRGIQFRQWANKILKEYLLSGYVVNTRITALERQVIEQGDKLQNLNDKVDFFVRSSLPPLEGVFFDGQIFDAYAHIIGLIKRANKSIVLIDNYIDETTLNIISRRQPTVSATIYTRPLNNHQQLDILRHNQQYPPITVKTCQNCHDRFLIIDDEIYLFGASLKDAGKKLFAYIKMNETTVSDILSRIK